MQEKAEQIKLPHTEGTRLPLGYKKIRLDKIPPLQVENELMLYNKKYQYKTMQILQAGKPVSKILK